MIALNSYIGLNNIIYIYTYLLCHPIQPHVRLDPSPFSGRPLGIRPLLQQRRNPDRVVPQIRTFSVVLIFWHEKRCDVVWS